MRRAVDRWDRAAMVIVAMLMVLGLYNLASAGRPLGVDLHIRQGIHMAIGCGLALATTRVHYRHLEGLAYPLFFVAVALLLLTDVAGTVVNGSRRWLGIGGVNIQTSDIAKLAVIVAIARVFHRERWDGGLTLVELFRPLNVSRPFAIVVGVLLVLAFGDRLSAPMLQFPVGARFRPAARLRSVEPVISVGGGESDARVRIARGGVGEHHADVVRIEDGHYVLRDLAPDRGTFVNDQRVDGERRLHHGDVVRFGLAEGAVLRFKDSLEGVRPVLPWIAVLGAIWLFVSVYVQFQKRMWTHRDLVAPIDIVAVPCVLILAQPDLGTALIVALVAFSMILFVGLRPVSLLLLSAFGAVGGALAWSFVLKPYQKERVLTFLNPTSDLAGAGYHQHQSMIAIGSGGLDGQGHGHGTQTQLSFLPEQQTDFIFSAWAEEHGFLGSIAVVTLFAVLVALGFRIAMRARDRFGALIAFGVTALLFWHAAINMAMVLQLAPVVGVPLPLWSNGGSFAITVLMGLGLLFNVSANRNLF